MRSEERRILNLVAEGYTRSTTLREIVDQVEALPCLVYIGSVVKLSGGLQGALIHTTGGRPDFPMLRVLLRTNLSRDEEIALIAHELQHVVEAMTGYRASGGSWMTDLFDKLDPEARTTGVRTYETDHAREITFKVREELKRTPPRHTKEPADSGVPHRTRRASSFGQFCRMTIGKSSLFWTIRNRLPSDVTSSR